MALPLPELSGSAHEVEVGGGGGGQLTTMTSRAGPTKAQMAPLPRASQQLWREKKLLEHPFPQRYLRPAAVTMVVGGGSAEKEFVSSGYQR